MSQSSKIRYVPLSSLPSHSELESWLACAIHADGSRYLVVIERIPRAVSEQKGLLRGAYEEIKRAAALSHHSLLSARDLFQRDDGYYIALNFAPAETLEFIWQSYAGVGNAAPLALTARVIAEAAAALDAVRRQSAGDGNPLIHAHLSPQSLLLGYDGRTRIVGHGTSTIHQALGQTRGGLPTSNLGYCAPELFQGAPADARSDMFALGVVLWELLTGKQLFARSGPFETMRAICDEPVAKPSSIYRTVPSRLDPILARVLAKDPARRYGDYAEFLGALESILQLPGVSDQSMRLGSLLSDRFPMRASTWSEVARAEGSDDFKHAAKLVNALQKRSSSAAAPPTTSESAQFEQEFRRDPPAPNRPEKASIPRPSSGSTDTDITAVRDVPDRAFLTQESSPTTTAHDEPTQVRKTPMAEFAPQPASDFLKETKERPEPNIPESSAPIPEQPEQQQQPEQRQQPEDSRQPEAAPAQPSPPEQTQPLEATPSPQIPTPGQPDPYFDGLDWDYPNTSDEDDEDDNFESPFALEEILESSAQIGASRREHAGTNVMEIVRHANDHAFAIHSLRGLRRWYRDREAPFKASLGGKTGTIKIRKKAAQLGELHGWIQRRNDGGNRREIDDISQKITLKPGDQCELKLDEVSWRIRVFRPPLAPPSTQPTFTRKNITLYAACLGLAVLLHLFAMLGVLAIQAAGAQLTVTPDAEQVEAFAEGKLKDIKKPTPPDKPEPPPDKPKPTKPAPVPDDPTEQQAQIPKTVKEALAKRVPTRSDSNENTAEKTKDVLKMLKSPNPGSGKSINEVVSNTDAVKKPGGDDSGYNVAGTIAGLKGNKVNMALGGGGKRGKLSAGSAVGKDIGKLAKRKSSGKVRGKVTSIKALSKVSGSLSRSDVYKTIDRYIGKLQACYESRLSDNPSLSGKVVFSWTVKTNGRVKGVRQKSSTLADAKASRCLSRIIKTMKFPHPKGGEVEISYPFMFQQR